MPTQIELALACGDYEIVRPLKSGEVKPDGIHLNILTAMDSTTRHWRILRNREFELGELSAAAYLVARDKGLPFRAIPVFLHRRFRHGFVFVNTNSQIRRPADLIGRKVGLKSYQVTAGLWMRGILEHEYAVPHNKIEWYAEFDEDVDFVPPPGVKLTRLGNDNSIETMLVGGDLDAVISPDLIDPFLRKDPRVAQLFPNSKDEEIAYFRKTGIFPIMHVMAIKQDVAERYPWVAINLFSAFNEAKAIAMKRMRNPRIVPLAWYRQAWEEQEAILGPDPWQYGLTDQNRHQLNLLVEYAHEQGLISRRIPLDELFLNVSQGRKRGEAFRI